MSKIDFTIPRDAGGHPPDGTIWTGEIQRIAFAVASSAATQVTVPGPWYSFYATNVCHIVFGGKTDLRPATTTGADTCYPIPSGSWSEPVYVPDSFRNPATGTGTLYIRVIRNASDGSLYIAQAYPSASSRSRGSVIWPTSTSTTTTTTTSTTTSTSTTSTSTTTTSTSTTSTSTTTTSTSTTSTSTTTTSTSTTTTSTTTSSTTT